MDTSRVLRTPLLILTFVCASAHAESRCDCTTILDTCNATVTVENDSVSIESDHLQCARVDYLIDGLPFVALVVEGSGRQSWLSRNGNPRVLMQSCQVCLDNSDSSEPSAAPAPPANGNMTSRATEASRDGELAPLLSVDPQYPSAAASRGIEGFVEVSYTVTALGLVEDASVTAAEPPGVFEESALSAISRWRYGADERREAVIATHRFDFEPEDAVVARATPSRASAETAIDALIARSSGLDEASADADVAAHVSRPVRNQCIRERESYDFGEMVEVNLMNTCDEPLMVYSCAEGLGRYHRRWVCHSTEKPQSILVRPGDRLAGNVAMIEVPEGIRTYRYGEDLFVARARNTEYWWLACAVDDAECRGSGRQWARSMDGKPATVDPQLWTEQSVARSF